MIIVTHGNDKNAYLLPVSNSTSSQIRNVGFASFVDPTRHCQSKCASFFFVQLNHGHSFLFLCNQEPNCHCNDRLQISSRAVKEG